MCGLRGVERQVGSTRWTRWPNEIKCGPHGGKRKTRRSREHEPVHGGKRKTRRSHEHEPVQGSGSQPESARGVW
jgi:hypothetical protein